MLLFVSLWVASAPSRLGGPPVAGAFVVKGIISPRLEVASDAQRGAIVREMRGRLEARWVRVSANWSAVEPERGVYDADELAQLDGLVHDLHAAGARVILTVVSVPEWASDTSLWSDPPPTYAPGYQPFYPMRAEALADFGSFGRMLAERYGRRINGLECWNEPNLWVFLYPQRVAGDRYFGARTYLRMLKAFTRGVRSSGVRVPVIAGATAPVGTDDKLRTSPLTFARFLKKNGAASWFDAYSHHPYTPGGSVFRAPDKPPNDPRTTVTLYNLGSLLRLFPGRPFYLTEYGYNTQPSLMFGGFSVSERLQARYLKEAYAMASRHKQVKALFWYLLTDSRPAYGPPNGGVYTGLRRTDGTRKPSWYAYRNVP